MKTLSTCRNTGGEMYFTSTLDNQQLKQRIIDDLPHEGREFVTFIDVCGRLTSVSNIISLSSFFLRVYRQFKLNTNERITVLSHNDQLVSLQLCLANDKKEKMGDLEVDVSTILLTNKHISQYKCDPSIDLNEQTKLYHTLYETFLQQNNYQDLIDVYLRVKEALQNNNDVMDFIQKCTFVFVGHPQTDLEEMMLKTLCENHNICEIIVPESESGHITVASSDLSQMLQNKPCNINLICSPPPTRSVSENHVTSVLLSYIELLVNSRSELALARSLNSPDRGLDHVAFTALKRSARDKNMPMYQLILSHTLRVRLGGKGYAPDPNSALMQHVKGLGLYTDLVHRLQTVIEEYTDTLQACTRIINILRSLFLKSTTQIIRPTSVNKSADSLIASVNTLLDDECRAQFVSPVKSIGDGGSQQGRGTLRVLRDLCDLHTTLNDLNPAHDLFEDVITSQKTPLRLPSLLSQFRSPEDVDSPDTKVEKSLATRLMEKKDKRETRIVRGHMSSYDWAAPVNAFSRQDDDDCLRPSQIVVLPCKTMVVCGDEGKRVTEAAFDKENITQHEDQPSDETTKVMNEQTTEAKSKKRRAFGDSTNQMEAAPKRLKVCDDSKKGVEKVAKKSKAKSCRRKLEIPQMKGQQSLMKFFRV